jgi:N6-adenosine-specific RNA methylase IME4
VSISEFIPFPQRQYNVIYADPPWRYSDKGCNVNAADHYPTMPFSEMRRLPVGDLAAKDCVLFMWTTYPMMREALFLIDAWGFTYKNIAFQWVKQNRSSNELPILTGGVFAHD